MSYIRRCRSCDQRISMRKMPHGKWVAFELGDSEPHVCGSRTRSAAVSPLKPSLRGAVPVDVPSRIPFVVPDIEIPFPGRGAGPARVPSPESGRAKVGTRARGHVRMQRSQPLKSSPQTPVPSPPRRYQTPTGGNGLAKVVFWACVVAIVLWYLASR
jgi:hypothetical protein